MQNQKEGKFFNDLFLVNKRDWDHIPVTIFKHLTLSSLSAFQNGRNDLIKDLLQENDFLIKIDLKDLF